MAYAVILSGHSGVSSAVVLAVLFPLLFGLWSGSSLWAFFVCVVSEVEVAVLLLFRLLVLRCVPRGVSPSFRLEFLLLALSLDPVAPWAWLRRRPGPPRVLRSRVLSSRSSSMVFLSVSTRFRILAVFVAFCVLRSARQVE